MLKQSQPNGKTLDLAVVFFFIIAMIFCFTTTDLGNLQTKIEVFYFNVNRTLVVLVLSLVFFILSLFNKPKIDILFSLLFISAGLGLLPLLYVENINSYSGNYLPLIITVISYFICSQSLINIQFSIANSIYHIFRIVIIIISIQVIYTELSFFNSLSFSNFGNVSVKGSMNIPLGSSNLIAAFLLPIAVFILTFKRSQAYYLIACLALYATLLCRSKNALLLIVALLVLLVGFLIYKNIVKNTKINLNDKLPLIIFTGILFIGLIVGGYKLIGVLIQDLQFTYYSSYNNKLLNFLDVISSGRVQVLHLELVRMSDHLLLGNGYGYELGQQKSHNWVVELLVQRGIIGFVIYLVCILSIFKIGYKYYNDVFIRSCVNFLAIIFVQGLFEVTIFTMGMDFLIWSIAGFMVARVKSLNSVVAVVSK